jgi:hypothetical protein
MAPIPTRVFNDAAEMQQFYVDLQRRLRPDPEPKEPPQPEPPAAIEPPLPLPEPPLPPPPPALQRACTLRELRQIVPEIFGLPEALVFGDSRSPDYTTPRHLCFALARHLTTASLTRIGKTFGRDHSSVHNATSRMQWLIAELHEGLPESASLYEWVQTGFQILHRKDETRYERRRKRRRAYERRERERQERYRAARRTVQMVRDDNAGLGEHAVLAMSALEHANCARSSFGEANDCSVVASATGGGMTCHELAARSKF